VATDATALAAPAPVTVLTSDPEDLTALCDARTTAIKICDPAGDAGTAHGRSQQRPFKDAGLAGTR